MKGNATHSSHSDGKNETSEKALMLCKMLLTNGHDYPYQSTDIHTAEETFIRHLGHD